MHSQPTPERLRNLLLRSVTYVRAAFPWELRGLSAANDASLPPASAAVIGFPRNGVRAAPPSEPVL